MDWPLLRRVSRSFYLTLRLLPPQVRESIALAYLVARLSDTLADGAQTEGEKQLLARRKEIEGWLEKFDPDEVDYSVSDGVITIEFADGARYVLNRQTAASQMWFAAGARAWHYDWNEARGAWVDDRDGHAGGRPGRLHFGLLHGQHDAGQRQPVGDRIHH